MNFNLLNKKWTSYFNWTALYPSYFLLFVFIIYFFIGSIAYLGDFKTNALIPIFFFLSFAFIYPIFFLLFIYSIWFIVASDKLFQLLGYNRLLANIINIFLTYSGLLFITVIFLWMKIKDIYEENNIECSWSGKIK